MTNRVFVTQENPTLNYSPAEEFGEVVFLTAGDFSPMEGSLKNVGLVAEVQSKLIGFNPEFDYIVPSGSPIITGVVFLVLGLNRHHTVRVLRWSNRDHLYQPIRVIVPSLKP